MTILVATDEKVGFANSPWKQLTLETVKANPEHRFVLPVGSETLPADLFPNLMVAETSTILSLPVFKKIRKKLLLTKLIREYRAELVLGIDVVLPVLSVPNVLMLSDETVIRLTKNRKPANSGFKSLYAANHIVVPSAYSKKLLAKAIPAAVDSVSICSLPVNEWYKPLDWEEKQAWKEQFSSGAEYFLYNGPVNNSHAIITLLKAFSLFKKRQMSSMKLLLNGPASDSFHEKLATYKYRNDVQLLQLITDEKKASLFASAYAIINPITEPGFSITAVQAIMSGTPAISCSAESSPASGSVLFCDQDPEQLSGKMKQVYKDEHLRTALAENAISGRENYMPETLSKTLWLAISKTVTKL